MQICVHDHVEFHPQKKKEVLYFVKKKTWEKQESRVISCQNQSRTLNTVAVAKSTELVDIIGFA